MGMRRVELRHRFGRDAGAAVVLLGLFYAPGAYASKHAELLHTQHGSVARAPGYLGIGFHDLTDDQAAAMHLKGTKGVEVIMVDHDGPAGKSGLRPHDIIVSLNGQMVMSAELLRRMIHDFGAGVGLTLGILRAGKAQNVSVQLSDRADVEREARARMADPAAAEAGAPVAEGAFESYTIDPGPQKAETNGPTFLELMLHTAPFTGLAMEAMEPQLATFFGSATGQGLLVETVMQNSPAANAGLHAGDVVVRVDGIALKSTSEWMKRLHANKGQTMVLVVLRDKKEQSITLTPEYKKHSTLVWPRELSAMQG
jgi:serine protease Do